MAQTLTTEELTALSAQVPAGGDATMASRVLRKDDGRHVFLALRKTPRAFAGRLDTDTDTDLQVPAVELTEFTLISHEDFEYEPQITDADRAAAAPVDAKLAHLESYYAYDAGLLRTASSGDGAGLPSLVDHRPQQSGVKSQGGRGTCVSHATMGLLEAYPHINDNLSEQYTHYKFNVFLGRPHNVDDGLTTTDAAPFLARSDGRVCMENEWPYLPNQATINEAVANGTYGPPQAAVNNQRFGINAYKIIPDNGLTGESIKNTRYLEALLYQGYNVVFGCYASWDDKDNNGVLDPLLDNNGTPLSDNGHAILIVGYNQAEQYFIVKNSWDTTWGHDGYGYFSYNFMRACAKYGFVVDAVVPAAPPTALPSRLVTAPYSTERVSRADLRGAIVFFKTSSGRYAIAEAYAGDNLYLRNLRVYNADGSVHKHKDELVIRSSFLCDLDTARETSTGADFWWHGVSAGVHFLEPRNSASISLAFDIAGLTAAQINAMTMSTPAVERPQFAVIAGRTTSGRAFKIVAHSKPGNVLELSYAEVFNADGSRFRYGQGIGVPSSWTFDLDVLTVTNGAQADLWWHVVSSNIGYLERYSSASMRLVWTL
jgi:C1A family cysteine protease